LHDARLKASPAFAKAVVEILRAVAMADADFKIAVTPCTPTLSGADSVDFLFSANAAVEARPIEKIASGGELSRVMLALKTILAKHLALPTIIFDEIDTGISGRTANDVGDIISQLAKSMQVIDITHSPQVASKGTRHFLVYKEHSCTHIRPLSNNERVEEIAKMLSGNTVTEAALAQAKHLLSV
jgi:DNA repair protein RecN (Recombination protein N)